MPTCDNSNGQLLHGALSLRSYRRLRDCTYARRGHESIEVSQRIDRAIVRLRGQNVMLDADLARLYGVETKALNQAVRRNTDRFPSDFTFQLDPDEAAALRSQSVTLNAGRLHALLRSQSVTSNGRGGRRPSALRLHRAGRRHALVVLRSPRAIAVNIEIMRAFVQLRRILDSNADLSLKVAELERRYNGKFKAVFEAIRQLMAPPTTPSKRIGFRREG